LTASPPPSSNEPVQERASSGSSAQGASREPALRGARRASTPVDPRESVAHGEQWTVDGPRAAELRAALGLAPAASVLEALWSLQPARWLRRIPGRETFAWPDEDGPYLVKRMRASPARAPWLAPLAACVRRLRGLPAPRGSAAHEEARALAAWRELGVRAPEPLLWVEEAGRSARGAEARCALVMERIAHARTLREELEVAAPRERVRWLALLARRVRALHSAGWCHRDLYFEHWILPEREPRELALIDAGRAFAQPRLRARWIVKDLAALAHSRPPALTRSESWRALLAAAPPEWVRTRAQRRALARRVLGKARRLAAHEPRHWYDRAAQRGSSSQLVAPARGARA